MLGQEDCPFQKPPTPYSTKETWTIWSTTHPNVFTEETWANQRSGEFELKYPDYLRDEQIQYLIIDDPLDAEGITWFRSWLAMSDSDSFETTDPLRSGNWFSHLWLSWKKLVYNGSEYSNESAQRQAADDLIIYAFQMRNGAGHVFRPQVPVLVPPDQLISDAMTTMDLPGPWAFYIQGLKNRYIFSWSWRSVLSTLYGAQKLSTLYGAQKHRRALGMTDGFVFGSILNDGEMSIYVSHWRNDTLIVDDVFHPFKLEIFGYFVECFFSLCKISDFQKKWLEDEFGRWNEAMNVQKKKLFDASESKDVWRDRPDDGPSALPNKTKRGSADPNAKKVMAEARILAQAIMSNSRHFGIIYFPTERNIVALNIVTDAGTSEHDYQKNYPASPNADRQFVRGYTLATYDDVPT
ncbi:hypothetical protein ACEPAG_1245 [Sanghuangporus baumii]